MESTGRNRLAVATYLIYGTQAPREDFSSPTSDALGRFMRDSPGLVQILMSLSQHAQVHRGRIRLSPECEGFYPHLRLRILLDKPGVAFNPGILVILRMTARSCPPLDSARRNGTFGAT